MRYARLAVLFTAMATSGCASCQQQREAVPAPSARISVEIDPIDHDPPAEEQIRLDTELAKRIPDVTFEGARLEEVFEHFCKGPIGIFVNWRGTRGLTSIGIHRGTPLTLAIRNATLDQALTAVLFELGRDGEPLAYITEDGVITISTRNDILICVTEVYNVRSAITSDETYIQDTQRMIRRITGMSPQTWKNNGGSIGVVRDLSGHLIVTHTPAMQKRVAEALGLPPSKTRTTSSATSLTQRAE